MHRLEKLQNTLQKRELPSVIVNNSEILVTIIVVNRNGINHLKTLLPALLKNTDNVPYEFILVDNASIDDSVIYTESILSNTNQKIPFQIIQNEVNESFSAANNKAVQSANGKYLVLLNNDIEPLSGWLDYLLYSAESIKSVGSVGARLLYPYSKTASSINPFKKKIDKSFTIQHSGIAFKNEEKLFRPYNLGKDKSFDDPSVLINENKTALTAACLLVPKEIYFEVGGLDESYNYGGEDVDFGLKLLKFGYTNYYCADSVLLHHEFGTQSKDNREIAANRRSENLKVFQHKWFIHIKKAYWTDKIFGKSFHYAESPLSIAILENSSLESDKFVAATKKLSWELMFLTKKQFRRNKKNKDCDFLIEKKSDNNLVITNNQFSVSVEKDDWAESFRNILIKRYLNPSIAIKIPAKTWKGTYSWGDYHMAVLLKKELQRLGHYVLLQIYPEWDNDEGQECDIVIVLRGVSRYKVKPHQVNIMWNISHPDDVSFDEYEEYDRVYIASEFWANVVSKQVSVPVEAMIQCTDVERFRKPSEQEKIDYHQQLLFVGNSRGVYRKILKDLLPTKHDLAIYGRSWKKVLPKNLIKGEHIQNDELYKYYGSADILLNDHWDDMREKGFVSNRIFDGLACGAFIITDNVNYMGDLKNYLEMYDNPDELKEKLEYYLKNSEKRSEMIERGIDYIRENHTFKERARVFSDECYQLLQNRLDSKGI